jgi:ABC-type transport system involved in multi-copper enzyme maturation permease subunit
MARRWSTWIPLVLVFGLVFFGNLIRLMNASYLKTYIAGHPLAFLYAQMEDGLALIRIFSGLYLLVIVAYVIGLEYQMGTIRVLLARGVSKLTLLSAKVASLVIVALLVLLVSLILTALANIIVLFATVGNLQALNSLTGQFWSDTGLYLVTVLINTGVTILLATAISVLGRSLTIGLSVSLAWFPADNLGAEFMRLGYALTNNDFWKNITAYFLGPNLNVMAPNVLPKLQASSAGIGPLVNVDGAHTLWVALAYAMIFAAVAIVLTWKRDVKE